MLLGRGSDCGFKEKIVGTASGLSLHRALVPGISLALEVTFETIFGEVHRTHAATFPDWRVSPNAA